MKKILAALFAVLLMGSGCASQGEHAQPTDNATEALVKATDITELQTDTYKKNTYADITEVEYVKDNIKIVYPQFIKKASLSDRGKVNELIRSGALSIIDTYDKNRLDDLFLEAEYEIALKTDDVISIKFFGYGNLKGAAHPNRHFYTINVDLHEAEKLCLEDFIDSEDLAAVIKDKNMSFEMRENESLVYTYYVNELLDFEKLSGCDKPGSEMYSYLTKTSLGISFPTPHALGDYKKAEVDYGDLEFGKDELEEFYGKWRVGGLKVTPRAALVEESYAKENTSVTDMEMDITENGVLFDNKRFYCDRVESCDAYELMNYFNLPSGQASLLCGGSTDGEEIELREKNVKLIELEDVSSSARIDLLICQDNTLMLWVGEQYEYIGFYELIRLQG